MTLRGVLHTSTKSENTLSFQASFVIKYLEKYLITKRPLDEQGSHLMTLTGFEPVTHGLKVRCSTN